MQGVGTITFNKIEAGLFTTLIYFLLQAILQALDFSSDNLFLHDPVAR